MRSIKARRLVYGAAYVGAGLALGYGGWDRAGAHGCGPIVTRRVREGLDR